MLNMERQRELAGIKGIVTESKPKKKTDYCIIDHIGALPDEKVMQTVYKMAYELTRYPKDTYTMKKLIQMQSPYTTQVTQKQKNLIRGTKHPKQVIMICTCSEGTWNPKAKGEDKLEWTGGSVIAEGDYDRIASKVRWMADNWIDKTDYFDMLLVNPEGQIEHLTIEDLRPEFTATFEAKDTIYRRCASIWGAALGWQFSAPLYRDTVGGMNELFMARPSKAAVALSEAKTRGEAAVKAQIEHIKEHMKEYTEKEDHSTKISTRGETFLKGQAVASEEECKEFFEYYKYLQVNNLVSEFLESGYYICPECGRPVRETAENCEYCNFIAESYIELDSFFEDSFQEDEA